MVWSSDRGIAVLKVSAAYGSSGWHRWSWSMRLHGCGTAELAAAMVSFIAIASSPSMSQTPFMTISCCAASTCWPSTACKVQDWLAYTLSLQLSCLTLCVHDWSSVPESSTWTWSHLRLISFVGRFSGLWAFALASPGQLATRLATILAFALTLSRRLKTQQRQEQWMFQL